jgi:signal transduction histidine kinase
LHVEPEKLFDRFIKNDQSSDSLGLGLAMVKQICKSYGFEIELTCENNVYSIQVIF